MQRLCFQFYSPHCFPGVSCSLRLCPLSLLSVPVCNPEKLVRPRGETDLAGGVDEEERKVRIASSWSFHTVFPPLWLWSCYPGAHCATSMGCCGCRSRMQVSDTVMETWLIAQQPAPDSGMKCLGSNSGWSDFLAEERSSQSKRLKKGVCLFGVFC